MVDGFLVFFSFPDPESRFSLPPRPPNLGREGRERERYSLTELQLLKVQQSVLINSTVYAHGPAGVQAQTALAAHRPLGDGSVLSSLTAPSVAPPLLDCINLPRHLPLTDHMHPLEPV